MKIKAINAFNAMFVDTGVCGSYTTPYAELLNAKRYELFPDY